MRAPNRAVLVSVSRRIDADPSSASIVAAGNLSSNASASFPSPDPSSTILSASSPPNGIAATSVAIISR
jgi:hypothetical protein